MAAPISRQFSGKSGDEHRSLRIADVEDHRLDAPVRGGNLLHTFVDGHAHVHLERVEAAAPFHQAQFLRAGSGADADRVAGDFAGVIEQRGGAAGAVAGKLGLAAVGVEEADGGIGGVARGIPCLYEHPAVGADAGVALADGSGDFGEAVRRGFLGPGEQEIVARAVGFGERDGGHVSGAARCTASERLARL